MVVAHLKVYDGQQQKILISFGKKVTYLREKQELTKVQLAYELGIDEKHLRRIEKGELNIGILLLSKLSIVLDVSCHELLNIE